MPVSRMFQTAAQAAADVSSAGSADSAVNCALAVASELGFHSISVVEKPLDQEGALAAVLFTNIDETQTSKYRARAYATVDPIVQRTLRGDGVRLLSGIGEENLSPLERKVFDSYHCASGVTEGLVIPVRRSVHPAGVITFGGVTPDLSAPAQAALTVLGHCVYGRLEDLRAAPTRAGKSLLSPRETQVLTWVAKGKADAEIAAILGMSERTARFHVANAKAKLSASTRVQAVTRALEQGLIEG